MFAQEGLEGGKSRGEDFVNKVFFGAEVIQHRRLGYSRVIGDILDRGRRDSLVREALEGGLENLVVMRHNVERKSVEARFLTKWSVSGTTHSQLLASEQF